MTSVRRSLEPEDLHSFLDLLVDESPNACVLVSENGQIVRASAAFEKLSGYDRDALVSQSVEILVPEEMRRTHVDQRARYTTSRSARAMLNSLSTVLRRADGSAVEVQIGLTSFQGSDGSAMTLATLHDTSEMLRAIRSRDQHEERFRLIFEGNMAPMAVVDLEDRIIEVNDAFCELVGYSRDELIGKDPTHFTHPDDVNITLESRLEARSGRDRVRYAKRYVRKSGEVITVEVMRTVARDDSGEPLYHLISERDISEEVRLTDRLKELALSDALTGLPNRILLEDRYTQARARREDHDLSLALFFIDVDAFKGVNDSLGHTIGDEFLVAVARRLESVTRPSDTVCRFGGDEFVYLATNLHSPRDAEGIAERLSHAFDAPFDVGGGTIARSASIGITHGMRENDGLTDLLRRADIALYEAKRKGRRQTVFYDASMHEISAGRFNLEQDLRTAIWSDQVVMHYQPIVEVLTGHIRGFEALMRWTHPERGEIPPSVFIPVAEESDLIVDVGRRALADALRVAKEWAREFPDDTPYMAVNASARRFHQPSAIDAVLSATAESGLAPERLVIEMTEQAVLGDPEGSRASLRRLESHGIRVALDDFGTGYSSLSHLVNLRPSIIKVDRSFIAAARDSEEASALLSGISLIGERLGITLVAEGVESEEIRDHLIVEGYAFAQGFLWSHAVSAEEATAMLRAQRRSSGRH